MTSRSVRYAEKYAVKRCDKVATEHYKEMGLLTISFVASPLDDGAWGVTLRVPLLVSTITTGV